MILNQEFQVAFEACLESMLKISILVLLGMGLTFYGRLGSHGVSDLGSITYYVCLPALIFTNVAVSFDPKEVVSVGVIMCGSLFYIVSAYALVLILCRIMRVPPEEKHAVSCTVIFGNTGALAIALITSLAQSGAPDNASSFISSGVAYIAYFVVGQNLIMFSWGEYILRSEEAVAIPDLPASVQTSRTNPFDEEHRASSYGSVESSLSDASVTERTRLRRITKNIRKRLRHFSSIPYNVIQTAVSKMTLDSTALIHLPEAEDDTDGSKEDMYDIEEKPPRKIHVCESICYVIKKYFSSPPLLAALAGLCVASLPRLKHAFVGDDAPLAAVTAALVSAGRMQVPASMFMLSGAGTLRILQRVRERALSEVAVGENMHFSIQSKLIIWFGRNLFMALIGVVWYFLCMHWNLYNPKGLMPFVMFLEAIVPSAQNVVMLLLVHGSPVQANAIAVLILQQYGISVLFLTFYLSVAFVYLDPFNAKFNQTQN